MTTSRTRYLAPELVRWDGPGGAEASERIMRAVRAGVRRGIARMASQSTDASGGPVPAVPAAGEAAHPDSTSDLYALASYGGGDDLVTLPVHGLGLSRVDPPRLVGPDKSSGNPTFDRWAAEQEAAEHAIARGEALARGFRPRADGELWLAAAEAAKATSDADLAVRVLRALRSSHASQDAERFVDLAVERYGQTRGYSSDVVFALAFGLKQEYAQTEARDELAERRRRVGEVAREIAGSPIRQANLRWRDRVTALAVEFGLDYDFVEEFLEEYDRAQKPRFPGTIDPRGVPFIQVAAPLYGIAFLIKEFAPGFGLYEGITGRDLLTGRELALWERALKVIGDLLPLAFKALRPVGTAIRFAGRAAATAGRVAADWAVAAVRLGVRPEGMLRYISRLGRLSLERVRHLYERIAQARRAGTAVRVTTDERRLLEEVTSASAELRGGAAAARATVAPPRPAPTGRQLTAEQAAQVRDVDVTLPKFLEKYSKVDLDAGTLAELRELFKSTRKSGGRYVPSRAASGELAIIHKLQNSDAVARIRLLRPGKGRLTPDIEVVSRTGERYQLEITTPTLARKGQRGPARTGPERTTPPADKTQEATSEGIKGAFARKLKDTAQISAARPGVVVVNVQRLPRQGTVLTRAEITELEALIANKPYVRELLVSVPGPSGRRLLRVGTRDSGLGLAEGAVP